MKINFSRLVLLICLIPPLDVNIYLSAVHSFLLTIYHLPLYHLHNFYSPPQLLAPFQLNII